MILSHSSVLLQKQRSVLSICDLYIIGIVQCHNLIARKEIIIIAMYAGS